MRMFTKMGVTIASAGLPVLLWAGAAGAQTNTTVQSPQSQITVSVPPTIDTFGGNGGTLARTGAEDMLPLAVGGAALAGALVVRRGLRRRSPA